METCGRGARCAESIVHDQEPGDRGAGCAESIIRDPTEPGDRVTGCAESIVRDQEQGDRGEDMRRTDEGQAHHGKGECTCSAPQGCP